MRFISKITSGENQGMFIDIPLEKWEVAEEFEGKDIVVEVRIVK